MQLDVLYNADPEQHDSKNLSALIFPSAEQVSVVILLVSLASFALGSDGCDTYADVQPENSAYLFQSLKS